ncbi:proline--tRNA ligase [Campylobacter sp. IFREMER_LSEM_CL1846]|uniref:proline--tRNA ligase n=1 Tax=Campylobacter sp. IFREMER_LSEM_CL1846 TaxID=2911614 RepID=UPI0021E637E2|nr:proline--tRNA ligase [Campylobacter sp. IFREMER_LSEM_CL1846]HEC1748405.1 proline--tRNA ligase [Campylobacter lari]MCV3434117.1 proline--tRNA ligase [Campylobacter sp. IFREMER_LSEM_CL1846]HEC1768207.1 proline--tRNA ligase [Campylobacter lari]HEC1789505.1 proline--tRNA ligase [Campylobacter lari]HEC1795810.1 proline--tRNA ligase [Campylobacter lari]
MMKFSKFYAISTKENPKDATLPSHIFLVKGAFVEQIGSGLYNFLPLGKRVLDKIKNIIKEEMDKAGALEVNLSFNTPAELWKESGRFNVFGKELLRFKDRKENDFVLGPTHEEAIVALVRNKVNSYKQLPLHLYQIGLKFRDEARPRFGLLRCREFLMKDGYSFHSNEADLDKEFNLMHETYSKILTRLGLDFRAVEADSGAIGGSGSKEFMVLAKNGEDDILLCEHCDYAANIEAAKRAKKSCEDERPEADFATQFHTPNVKTMEELAEFFKINPYYTVKAIAKKAIYENEEKIVVFFIRGDDELQEVKALNAANALELADVSEEELEKAGLVPGFIGFVGLNGVDFYIDRELENETNMIIGANKKDYHLVGINVVNLNKERFKDLTAVKEHDLCPKCQHKLKQSKGIEVGHIFKLGNKYSKAMNASYLDENGKAQFFTMGCYGMGVSRLVAVAIEASHDEKGCIWNKTLAPFVLDIIVSNIKDTKAMEFAEQIYTHFKDKEILFDDRNERFGVKINDFELMGFPYALVIGKGLESDEVELIHRNTLEKQVLKTQEVISHLEKIL